VIHHQTFPGQSASWQGRTEIGVAFLRATPQHARPQGRRFAAQPMHQARVAFVLIAPLSPLGLPMARSGQPGRLHLAH